MLSDHLKSTSALVARNGVLNVKYFYYPYGARRGVPFNTITARHFTGQYHETSLPGGEGLSFYNARWYDPKLGRFLSADTIVPNPSNPQDLNRLAYVRNNPLRYVDPSGHRLCDGATSCAQGGSARPGGGAAKKLTPPLPPKNPNPNTFQQTYGPDVRPPRGATPVRAPLPPAPSGFVWKQVQTPSGSTSIKITPYITVLESDREAYFGPMVPIPGLAEDAPHIPQGMLDDLWEEGSLKLLDGRYIQRDWTRTNELGYDVYEFIDPPPYAANGRVKAFSTGAAHKDFIPYSPPTVAYIVQINLQITVNDSGGLLASSGPLDVYVGEGLAAESNFGVHYSEVYILVPR
jgi:RHS repeat-associated protein